MWRVSIISMDDDGQGTDAAPYGKSWISLKPLPLCYMSDYSLLGLKVDRVAEALRILDESSFALMNDDHGPEVALDDPRRLSEIMDLLARSGIRTEITDVIDGVYQG